MRRLRVYIAGPISKGDLAHNVNQATAAFKRLAEAGFAPWCPHWSVYSGECNADEMMPHPFAFATVAGCGLSHADWLAVDLAWVEAADAVLRLPGESVGADAECRHAIRHGVNVFHDVATLQRWGELVGQMELADDMADPAPAGDDAPQT